MKNFSNCSESMNEWVEKVKLEYENVLKYASAPANRVFSRFIKSNTSFVVEQLFVGFLKNDLENESIQVLHLLSTMKEIWTVSFECSRIRQSRDFCKTREMVWGCILLLNHHLSERCYLRWCGMNRSRSTIWLSLLMMFAYVSTALSHAV